MKGNAYWSSCTRDICHAVKGCGTARDKAVREIALWYEGTGVLGEDCILIPVPQHTGKAEYTLEICSILSERCGCKIADVLERVPCDTLYSLKKKGMKLLFTGIYRTGNVQGEGRIFLIDNVVSTGLTMSECMRLVRNAEPFAYACAE